MLLYFFLAFWTIIIRTHTSGTKISAINSPPQFFCVKMYTFNDIDNRLPGGDRQTDRDREKVCCCVVAVSRKRENGGARSKQKLNVSRREKTQHLMIFPFFFKRCISSFLSAHLAAPKQDNSARNREKEKRKQCFGGFFVVVFYYFLSSSSTRFCWEKIRHTPASIIVWKTFS